MGGGACAERPHPSVAKRSSGRPAGSSRTPGCRRLAWARLGVSVPASAPGTRRSAQSCCRPVCREPAWAEVFTLAQLPTGSAGLLTLSPTPEGPGRPLRVPWAARLREEALQGRTKWWNHGPWRPQAWPRPGRVPEHFRVSWGGVTAAAAEGLPPAVRAWLLLPRDPVEDSGRGEGSRTVQGSGRQSRGRPALDRKAVSGKHVCGPLRPEADGLNVFPEHAHRRPVLDSRSLGL